MRLEKLVSSISLNTFTFAKPTKCLDSYRNMFGNETLLAQRWFGHLPFQ